MRAGWQGPLPPPSILQDFDHLVHNGAERIFKQFEDEADHRRARERKSDTITRTGQGLAALFAIGMIGLTGYAIHEHAFTLAGVLGGGTITTGIAAFLGSRWMRGGGE